MHEHEALNIFRNFSIPVPQCFVTTSPGDAKRIAREMGKPVAIKAQVLVGGRGKVGAIKFASTPEDAEKAAREILSMRVGGMPVEEVLVMEWLDIERELYLAITVDRNACLPVVLASKEGGVDIEEIAEKYPEKIVRRYIDPFRGIQNFELRGVVKKIAPEGKHAQIVSNILNSLYKIYEKYDAELVEINPLVIASDGEIWAADARLIIDDNSLFRHPELGEDRGLSEVEKRAKKAGLAYVELDGNIGIIGNGAGLVMATLDVVQLFGGKPANFCDLGGGASAEATAKGVELVLSNPNVKALFINILAGITRCDEVARGVLKTMDEIGVKVPMVVRMIGTNEEEGRKIFADAGIDVMDSMEPAAKKVVEIVRRVDEHLGR